MRYLIVIIYIIFLSACTVDNETWEVGEELCKNNGGVDKIWIDDDVYCKDGAIFFGKTVRSHILKGK